jgi:hypothetical protein
MEKKKEKKKKKKKKKEKKKKKLDEEEVDEREWMKGSEEDGGCEKKVVGCVGLKERNVKISGREERREKRRRIFS